jgi:protein phosphatase
VPIRSVGRTDRGQRRKHNEDALLCDDGLGLYVVADGVGGHAKGEVASSEAVDQIHGFVHQGRAILDRFVADPEAGDPKEELRRLLESAVQSACYMVFGLAELDPTQKGMSTTISALLLCGGHAVIAQVGDSRIYRVRDGRGAQLTEDHTLVNYKLKRGLINAEEARTMKGKNVITRAVGHQDHVEVDTGLLAIQPGDRYLLCSDGLHGYLQEGEVERFLAGDASEEAAGALIDLANGRGGRDNITVVVVSVD